MGKWIADLAMMLGGQAMGAGIGALTAKANDKRQIAMQRQLMDMQMQGTKEMTDYSYGKQYEMWEKTGPKGQMEQLKKAGLNPSLIYGMGGAGGQTIGGGGMSVGGGVAPSGGGEIMSGMGMGLQLGMMKAQKDLLEAEAKLKNIEANNADKGGIDYELKMGQKELMTLEQVIKDYTGKEMKDYYEKVKKPNRSVEAKTYQDELEARQGVAGTIYDLWVSGKLEEKSWAEIEEIALRNKKTTEDINKVKEEIELLKKNGKTADLNNAILELEKGMQEKTGVDRNAPTWLKILARFFTMTMSK